MDFCLTFGSNLMSNRSERQAAPICPLLRSHLNAPSCIIEGRLRMTKDPTKVSYSNYRVELSPRPAVERLQAWELKIDVNKMTGTE